MSASNRRQTTAFTAVSRVPAVVVWRCASACVNGFAGLLQGIRSEFVNGLASHHTANHAYRFVLTERDTILVGHKPGHRPMVQAGQANAQPPAEQH